MLYYTQKGSLAVNLEEDKVMKNKRKFSFRVSPEVFKTSSWTGGTIARCVKVAITPRGVAVRDSKDVNDNTLFFKKREWDAFLKGAKDGEFDR